MLKPRALTELLGQANTGGVLNTMLLNNEGSVLAFSGRGVIDSRVTAAIASNIWTEYERCSFGYGSTSLDNDTDSLKMILLNCQIGKVAIAKVANLLLCIYANKKTPIGLLKLKIEILAKFLEEPLSEVASS